MILKDGMDVNHCAACLRSCESEITDAALHDWIMYVRKVLEAIDMETNRRTPAPEMRVAA